MYPDKLSCVRCRKDSITYIQRYLLIAFKVHVAGNKLTQKCPHCCLYFLQHYRTQERNNFILSDFCDKSPNYIYIIHLHTHSCWLLFTAQPFGLEGYCRHSSGEWAGGCQTCRTHISVTAWWIFSIRNSVELSRSVVVHCHAHLPHMGLPMGLKLVKFATNWVQTLWNAYLWNCWMDLPHLKFHGLV